ncbi:MAG: ABC transporter permease [Planctomycetota bacterium]
MHAPGPAGATRSPHPRRPHRRAFRASACILGAIVGLALLTPALPLELPDRTRTDRALQPPTWHGDDGFWLHDAEPAARLAELTAWDRQLVRLRQSLFGRRCLPPLCGRDGLGRCLLSRIGWGARLSIAVGLCAGLIALVCGVTYGAVAGYFGGWVDQFLMRAVDVLYGVPFIFVVIFLITVFRDPDRHGDAAHGSNLPIFFGVMGLVSWLTMARVVRGQVLSLREREYVTAARSLGARPSEVMIRHLLPNLAPVVVVYLTLTIPRIMLLESFVSFLGLGVQAPAVSWGLLARDAFEVMNPLDTPWWLVVWPALALGTTLFCLGVLGDTLPSVVGIQRETGQQRR